MIIEAWISRRNMGSEFRFTDVGLCRRMSSSYFKTQRLVDGRC